MRGLCEERRLTSRRQICKVVREDDRTSTWDGGVIRSTHSGRIIADTVHGCNRLDPVRSRLTPVPPPHRLPVCASAREPRLGAKREPGANPGLPRSGDRERRPHRCTGSGWEAVDGRNATHVAELGSPKTCPHPAQDRLPKPVSTCKPRGRWEVRMDAAAALWSLRFATTSRPNTTERRSYAHRRHLA